MELKLFTKILPRLHVHNHIISRSFSTKKAPDLVLSLQERGLVHSITGAAGLASTNFTTPLQDHLNNRSCVMYLFHFLFADDEAMRDLIPQQVGGATGMIGDPSGKSKERVLLNEQTIKHNASKIHDILGRCLSHGDFKLVNNMDWYNNMNVISFLRDIGKMFRINNMITKESVKSRLESNEGMSFTEFSYQLLQAYDFLELYRKENCSIQLGGSDQWGNITAGCDLIHKTMQKPAYGLTLPLLTTSSGQKIGKSEGIAGTIWLSEEKTSVYDFYQYFVRVDDADVVRYLKAFTFLPMEEIIHLESKHFAKPEDRLAQKTLAEEVTKFVHGEVGLRKAQDATSVLFGALEDPDILAKLKYQDLMTDMFKDVPKATLSKSLVGTDSFHVASLIAQASLAPSKSAVKRLLDAGGIYLNHKKVEDNRHIEIGDLIDSKFCLIRVGKKNYKFVLFE